MADKNDKISKAASNLNKADTETAKKRAKAEQEVTKEKKQQAAAAKEAAAATKEAAAAAKEAAAAAREEAGAMAEAANAAENIANAVESAGQAAELTAVAINGSAETAEAAVGALTNKTKELQEVSLGPTSEQITKALSARKAAFNGMDAIAAEYAYNSEEREVHSEANAKKHTSAILAYRVEQYNKLGEAYAKLTKDAMLLDALRDDSARSREDRLAEVRIAKLQEVTKAEIESQTAINKYFAELDYSASTKTIDDAGQVTEAGATRATISEEKAKLALIQEMEAKKADYIAKRELEAKRKNNGKLSKEEATRIEQEAAARFKLEKENIAELAAEREKKEAGKALKKELQEGLNTLKTGSFEERKEALKNLTHDADGNFDKGKAMSAAVMAIADLAKQLEDQIDRIAEKKGPIDTRLQGSNNDKTILGSYWDQLVKDMTALGAINPFYRQEDFASNIEALVKQGIAFDLKQRAFLMTIKDKIASTFDVANGTLLRLVRIQQEDSTAGRLGMESVLNAFLNNMYETTEYLSNVAGSVKGSLEEMEALMKGAEAAEVEFQVQKWMGSLYSVGMSDAAVQAIATALGQIASGQIEGLINGGAGNLLVMAANDAGVPIADILTNGIDAKDTNKLLNAAVNYLAELAKSAEDNKVVQQQLANVFGVKASDLRAASNLVIPGSTADIFKKDYSYADMIGRLHEMAGSMIMRTSVAEMMTNFWKNGEYSLASGMASNPISYFIYKMAKVVDDAAGGIDLPFLNVYGFGVDLNTTVSDLMRVAAVGAGLLGSIGPMISGLGSSFSGTAMLNKLGIRSGSGLAITPRGSGGNLPTGSGGASLSESGYAGNASGSDIKDSTIQESEDSKKQQMIEAKEEAEATAIDFINNTVLKIYEILDDVTNGKSSFTVKVEGYGLTKAGNGNGSLAGVGGITNITSGNNGLAGASASATTDFGSWTTATA